MHLIVDFISTWGQHIFLVFLQMGYTFLVAYPFYYVITITWLEMSSFGYKCQA